MDKEYNFEYLNSLIEQNPTFDEYQTYYLELLISLEEIIPINYRENFYNNIRTLKLFIDLIDYKDEIPTNDESGIGYNVEVNELAFSSSILTELDELSKKIPNSEAFFWREVNCHLLHEFSHLASSKYDIEKNIAACGLYLYNPSNIENTCKALNEGITEYVARTIVPSAYSYASNYYLEFIFTSQLVEILGRDTILNSYFGNDNLDKIQQELNYIIPINENNESLFQKIEANYYTKEIKDKEPLIADIQSILLEYFNEKIAKDLTDSSLEKETINKSVTNFERILVTPERLNKYMNTYNCFELLEESIKPFTNIKQSVEEAQNSSKIITLQL